MSAKDLYHEAVVRALLKDGWAITHDPYTLSFGRKNVFVDLGAERILAAQKDEEKIAIEIKSFQGASDLRELEIAIGQFVFYRSLLSRVEPKRELFLAVPNLVYLNTFDEPIVKPVIEDTAIKLVVFDPVQEQIVQWIP